MKIEEKYYENDVFWNPKNVSSQEKDRIEKTYELLPRGIKSIADIGCGNGIFVNYIRSRDRKIGIIGIDRSPSALKYVKTNKVKGDITDIPLKNHEYDLSVALEVIEHLNIEDYEVALKELARISKKYILISVPNNENLKNNFVECPRCQTQFSRSFHKRNFNEEVMGKLFEKYGFKNKYVKYIGAKKSYFIISPLYYFINRLIQKRNFKTSLLCPICGFHNKKIIKIKNRKVPQTDVRTSVVTLLNLWPKRTKYRWLIALYERRDNQ